MISGCGAQGPQRELVLKILGDHWLHKLLGQDISDFVWPVYFAGFHTQDPDFLASVFLECQQVKFIKGSYW